MKLHSSRTILTSALLASLFLGGCAGLDMGKAPEQIVAERAVARWNAVIANKWDEAYAYATPGYRAANSVEAYQARIQSAVIRREAVEVSRVECPQADACTATLVLSYQSVMPGYPRLSTQFTERWILDDGKWYIHVPL